MSKFIKTVVRCWRQLRGLFPSALPVGLSEFNVWSQSIADTYVLPTTNIDSIKFTLATSIMHLDATAARKPKYWFVLLVRASAAKQIAGAAFTEIKERSKAAQAAAAAEAEKAALNEPQK